MLRTHDAIFSHILIASVLAFLSPSVQAEDGKESTHPCQGQPGWTKNEVSFSDFAFWEGEWQVYDTETGELRGFDDVEWIMQDCVIKQHWRQMDDGYTQPGLPWRLNGTSLTGITWDGRWRQMWTDNNGGNIVLTGGWNENGRMELVSEWQGRPQPDGSVSMVRFIWYWQPDADGSIHNWGEYQLTDENQEKVKYFDISYQPNAVGWPAARKRQ